MSDFPTAKQYQHRQIHQRWVFAAQTDPQYGGPMFAANLNLAKQVLQRYGSKELVEFFNKTGVGSHPEVIRLLWNMGMDRSKGPTANDNLQAKRPKTIGELFYPGFDGNP